MGPRSARSARRLARRLRSGAASEDRLDKAGDVASVVGVNVKGDGDDDVTGVCVSTWCFKLLLL